jgi:hypothetical protein
MEKEMAVAAAVALWTFIEKGIEYFRKFGAEEQEKLQKLRLEVNHNLNALSGPVYDSKDVLRPDNKAFLTLASALDNSTASLFYQNEEAVKKTLKKAGSAANLASYTQYALNYTVTQIDSLKSLCKHEKGPNTRPVRLARRLDTLGAHLSLLSKILADIPVKLPPRKKSAVKQK